MDSGSVKGEPQLFPMAAGLAGADSDAIRSCLCRCTSAFTTDDVLALRRMADKEVLRLISVDCERVEADESEL